MSDARDTRRKVRWDDRRSGSSRASTVGGSSTTSSGYSGTAYPDPYADQRYNIAALEETLRETVSELDESKNKVFEAEERLRKHQKEQKETKARVTALEHANTTLEDDKKDLQREIRALKKELDSLRDDKRDDTKGLEREIKSLGKEIVSLREDKKELKEKNARLQQKVDKLDSRSEPSSPDSSKPRRSDSKRSKEAEQNARLKERLNKHSGDSSNSETGPSKPPSSSKTPHRSRRGSTTGDRPYVEHWGPGPAATMPVSPNTSSIRRPDNYIVTSGFPVAPAPASVPRSVRPSVEIPYHSSPYREDGNYHAHPLPPKP